MTRRFAPAVALALLLAPAAPAQGKLPGLKVSDNKRFLVTADGKPFFYLGDTAWELFHRLTREEADRYLRDRAAKGFTVIQAVVLAELDGLNDPNPYGHTPLNGNDPLKPNEDYFRHVDWVVDRAESLGLYVGMLPTWGDKWNPGKRPPGSAIFTRENAAGYAEWLANRYKSKPIVWVLGGDRRVETDEQKEVVRAMGRGLKKGDGGAHLVTFHPHGGGGSAEYFHADDWLDFNMRQNGHQPEFTGRYDKTRVDYDRTPVKPVLDGEPIYEDHPVSFKAKELGHSSAADVRRPLYWDLFSGACGHTYGHHSVWQMVAKGRKPINGPLMTWDQALNQPGAGQMQHGRRLIESRPVLTRIPDDTVIVPAEVATAVPGAGTRRYAATRDADGSYAMVYAPVGRPFAVRMDTVTGPKVRAWWFDPRTGAATPAGEFPNTGTRTFTPPNPGELLDWVLVLDDAAKDYPPPGGPGGRLAPGVGSPPASPSEAATRHELTVSGTRFLLDGKPFPYTGVSFFNAIYNPAFNAGPDARRAWLGKFKRYGVNVLRVWAQWDNGRGFVDAAPDHTLYRPDGSLRTEHVSRLKEVLADCDREGMVVELALFSQESWRENIRLGPAEADRAAAAVAGELAPYRNLALQVYNEMSDRTLDLVRVIKQVDPKRLVTNSPGVAGVLGDPKENAGLDFLTPHTSRQGAGKPWEVAPAEVAYLLKRFKKPVVDDEPARNGTAQFGGPKGDVSPFDHVLQIQAVRAAGGYPTYHHDMFQTGAGSPAVPPSGVPDPEWSPYHRVVFEFLAGRDRYAPAADPPPAADAGPVAPGAKPEKVAGGFTFTEGPAADPAGNVYFTDQPADRILKWSVDGTLTTFLQPAGRANGLCFDAAGKLWACADERNELWVIDVATKEKTVAVKEFGGKLLNGPNDVWVGPAGGAYFTDPFYKRPYWQRGPEEQDKRGVLYLSPDGKLSRVDADYAQPNGLVGTPDGKTLYVADIGKGRTYAYSIRPDGSLADRRVFCDQGSDGMTLDEDGNVYLTGKGGVTVFGKAGREVARIAIPEPWTANVCFGGKDMKTLFVTAGKSLYTVPMRVKGAARQ